MAAIPSTRKPQFGCMLVAQRQKRARTFAFVETPSTAAGIWMGLSVMLPWVPKMLRNAKLAGRLTVDRPAYPKKSR